MSFTLKIKDKVEERELDGELTIKDLLDDLELSSETMVSKKNGEIVIDEEKIEDGDEIDDECPSHGLRRLAVVEHDVDDGADCYQARQPVEKA